LREKGTLSCSDDRRLHWFGARSGTSGVYGSRTPPSAPAFPAKRGPSANPMDGRQAGGAAASRLGRRFRGDYGKGARHRGDDGRRGLMHHTDPRRPSLEFRYILKRFFSGVAAALPGTAPARGDQRRTV
jgi:hypothetical protein